MDASAYYSDNIKLIDDAIRIICRKYSISGDEEKDFAQHVHLQLIENDYRKLRAFKGASSLKTYLYTVISRIFIEQVRVKWHPSTEAKRMGAAAVELEKLVYRNQHAVHEACQMLAANPATAIDEKEARCILDRLPKRSPRPTRIEDSEERLPTLPDPSLDPEMRLVQKQQHQKKQQLRAIIGTILSSLSEEDKLLIKLRFISGHKMSHIGRMLGKDDVQLYKRTQSVLGRMRASMAEAGIGEDEIRELLAIAGETDD